MQTRLKDASAPSYSVIAARRPWPLGNSGKNANEHKTSLDYNGKHIMENMME
jgi:hypothetical protein